MAGLKKKQSISYGLDMVLNKIASDRIKKGTSPEDAVDPVKLDAVLDSEKKLKKALKKLG